MITPNTRRIYCYWSKLNTGEKSKNVQPILMINARSIINRFNSLSTNDEIIATQPSNKADVQAINRIKKKTRPAYPPQPESLSDIEFPEFLTKTLTKDGLFLFHDSGKEDTNRFFILVQLIMPKCYLKLIAMQMELFQLLLRILTSSLYHSHFSRREMHFCIVLHITSKDDQKIIEFYEYLENIISVLKLMLQKEEVEA